MGYRLGGDRAQLVRIAASYNRAMGRLTTMVWDGWPRVVRCRRAGPSYAFEWIRLRLWKKIAISSRIKADPAAELSQKPLQLAVAPEPVRK